MSSTYSLGKDDESKKVNKTKYEGDKDEQKSTNGLCKILGKSLVSWNSKKWALCLSLLRK